MYKNIILQGNNTNSDPQQAMLHHHVVDYFCISVMSIVPLYFILYILKKERFLHTTLMQIIILISKSTV